VAARESAIREPPERDDDDPPVILNSGGAAAAMMSSGVFGLIIAVHHFHHCQIGHKLFLELRHAMETVKIDATGKKKYQFTFTIQSN
jgi:hypothetical protein